MSRIRRFVRQLHLWLGLSLGALFVLLGLTGSVLVFYTEIDALLNPEIRVEETATPDLDKALATVRAAYPAKPGPWRFEMTGDGGVIPARFYNPPERAGADFAPMLVWVSPDGSRVLRRTYWGETVMTFLYDLHYRLLVGKTGAVVLGYAGIVLFVLLVTGLWAWWPRGSWRKALRYKSEAGNSRRWRDQHKLSGLWGLPLLLILTVTGVMLELPDESDAVLAATLAPIQPMPHPASSAWEGTPVSVSHAMAVAHKALPVARIAWVEVPGPGEGAFRIRMQSPGDPSDRFPHSFVWVDQYKGTLLAVSDTRNANASGVVNNWLHALHDGSFGGLVTRILTVLAGLVPLILFITGYRRWRLRAD